MPSLEAFEQKLRRTIDGEVRFDPATRAIYSTDASNYRRVPAGVVIPRHQDDVIRTVALARENSLPILARGGGTALAGQATTSGIVLDFSKYLNTIRAIDPARRLAVVEPGVIQSQLNAAAAKFGLFFAPDPATKDRCTLGGMIGNNSCGAHSAAYGKTVDNIEALEILLYDGAQLRLGGDSTGLADGRGIELAARLRTIAARYGDEVRRRYPSIPRRVSGYNLDQLLPENGFNLARGFVGSEGTLGIILNATVSLALKPSETALVVLGFEDVFDAADQTPWLLEYAPQALEGFDHQLPDFARIKKMAGVELLPAGSAFLLIELGGTSRDHVRDTAAAVARRSAAVKRCTGAAILTDPAAQAAVWSIRESGLGAGAFIPGYQRVWPGAEDSAVPPARLGDFLRRLVTMLRRYDLAAATYYGHFGEGCVHCRINFDFRSPKGVAKFRAAMFEIAYLVVEFGGSLSGEHGDGIARSELLPIMFGSHLIEAFRELKRAFDPDFRMNPGVIVDPQPLDSSLRIHTRPRRADAVPAAESFPTHFDFSAEGGLAGAALKCIGIGKCRKTGGGTMCPSYMGSREEMHSTRGRARLLYEALEGDLLKDGLADQGLFEALELCLSCKACKTECPAAVDMSAYKAEFLTHYYRFHRRPLQALFFGRIHEVARLGAAAPRLANLVNRGPGTKLVRWMLGVHPERRLPQFARETFRAWFARYHPPAKSASEVVLFPDTFTNFFEPAVAIAATRVLEQAGFRVIIPRPQICCGRPLHEAGMLDLARERLAKIVSVLDPLLDGGAAIVGLEPSCLLTLRDELPSMFPRSSAVRRIADRAMLFDEFLWAKAPNFAQPLRGHALLHRHCHQKALSRMDTESDLLSRSSDLTLEAPDSGCCGMAGAFGYGANRFELSRRIGERVLLPAIRASSPETIIIADGFACRAQIRQFCRDRHPVHLAEVLSNMTPGPATVEVAS